MVWKRKKKHKKQKHTHTLVKVFCRHVSVEGRQHSWEVCFIVNWSVEQRRGEMKREKLPENGLQEDKKKEIYVCQVPVRPSIRPSSPLDLCHISISIESKGRFETWKVIGPTFCLWHWSGPIRFVAASLARPATAQSFLLVRASTLAVRHCPLKFIFWFEFHSICQFYAAHKNGIAMHCASRCLT